MGSSKEESYLVSKVREVEKWMGFQTKIKWTVSFIVLAYHIAAVYWCYHYTYPVKWQTVLFAYLTFVFSGFGVTGGAHRYWAHRAFKASTPLRVIMMLGFATAGQNTLRQWVRNHRVHHKYSDTVSDPHNRERGLFFSHIGWLLMHKRPEVISKFNEIDMSDIDNDPLVQWHTKYVDIVNPLACIVIPTLTGILLWGEDWRVAIAWQCFIRMMAVYHSELTVNSLGHTLGYKPYNQSIRPAENVFIAAITGGEGWHNFHHAFPFDYRTAEWHHCIDTTTNLIHLFEKFGWVHDKREVSPETIKKYSLQHGEKKEQVKMADKENLHVVLKYVQTFAPVSSKND